MQQPTEQGESAPENTAQPQTPNPVESNPLRLNYVPGVFPDRWLDTYRGRFGSTVVAAVTAVDQCSLPALLDGADAALIRVEGVNTTPRPSWYPSGPQLALAAQAVDEPQWHFIPLYHEEASVLFEQESDLTHWPAKERLPADLLPSPLLDFQDYPAAVGGARMAVEVVATGAYAAVVPHSLLRAYNHRQVRGRKVDYAGPEPLWQVGLVFSAQLVDARDEDEQARIRYQRLQDLIGVLRGRSHRSSRDQTAQDEPGQQKTTGSGHSKARKGKKSPGNKAQEKKQQRKKAPERKRYGMRQRRR